MASYGLWPPIHVLTCPCCLTNALDIIPMKAERVKTLPVPASAIPQAASPVGKRRAKKGAGPRYERREDCGAHLGVRVPAPATATDKAVQRHAQEPDEHVIWMDTTSGAVFMIVSPKYCGEISGLEHAWDRLRSHLQVNRL
jgi:hypothetical protein